MKAGGAGCRADTRTVDSVSMSRSSSAARDASYSSVLALGRATAAALMDWVLPQLLTAAGARVVTERDSRDRTSVAGTR